MNAAPKGGSPYGARSTADIFEHTAIHDTPVMIDSERARIAAVRRLVPAGARRVLEVGCGDGLIIDGIAAERDTRRLAVGTDLSRRSLRQVGSPAVQSSILELPFADDAFDTVLCIEVLEHLPPDNLPAAAAELRRVTSRSLILAVPDREDLQAWSHRCPRCSELSHLHGHLSSLGAEDLLALFPPASRTFVEPVWPVRPFDRTLLRFRTERLGLWRHTRHTRCPHCGNTEFPDRTRHPLYLTFEALNLLRHPFRSRHRWVMLRLDYDTGP